jgi:hypothetical protein
VHADERRNRTPPEIARQYRIATKKVLTLIRTGELRALNLANRGCTRPRYSITPEALEEFERSREVIPNDSRGTTRSLRQRKSSNVRQFF